MYNFKEKYGILIAAGRKQQYRYRTVDVAPFTNGANVCIVCIGDKIALALCVCLCAHVYFLKPRLFPSEGLKLTQDLSNRLQLIYSFFK